MASRVWRVRPRDGGWQVKRDGAARATRTFTNKLAAVAEATAIARRHPPSRVVIHHSDGSVSNQTVFGNGAVLSYAGVFDGPADLGAQSEKYLAERFSRSDAGA